jgi:hypothetical protein
MRKKRGKKRGISEESVPRERVEFRKDCHKLQRVLLQSDKATRQQNTFQYIFVEHPISKNDHKNWNFSAERENL